MCSLLAFPLLLLDQNWYGNPKSANFVCLCPAVPMRLSHQRTEPSSSRHHCHPPRQSPAPRICEAPGHWVWLLCTKAKELVVGPLVGRVKNPRSLLKPGSRLPSLTPHERRACSSHPRHCKWGAAGLPHTVLCFLTVHCLFRKNLFR